MSKAKNDAKREQLGMAYGTARNKLQKELIFKMAKELGLSNCFQCGKPINNSNELSIEHKTPWLYSDDPVALFFDLDNIAFSHLSCNCKAARPMHTKLAIDGKYKCSLCGELKSPEDFHKHKNGPNGLKSACKECSNKRERERKLNRKC